MSLKPVYEKLESMEGGSEMIAQIKAELKQRDTEAATNRTQVNELQDKYTKMEENMSTILTQIQKGEKVEPVVDENDSLASKRLAKEFSELSKSVQEMREAKEKESTAKLELEKSNALTRELNKHGLLDDVLDDTIGIIKNRYQKDEQNVWVKEDGTTMEKDIEDFLSSKPHFLKNHIPGGPNVKKPNNEQRKATEFDSKNNSFAENWQIIKNKLDKKRG